MNDTILHLTSDDNFIPESLQKLLAIGNQLPNNTDLDKSLSKIQNKLKSAKAYNAGLITRNAELDSNIIQLKGSYTSACKEFVDVGSKEVFKVKEALGMAELELEFFLLGSEEKDIPSIERDTQQAQADIKTLNSFLAYVKAVNDLISFVKSNERQDHRQTMLGEDLIWSVKAYGGQCGRMPRAEKLINLSRCILHKSYEIWVKAGLSGTWRSRNITSTLLN